MKPNAVYRVTRDLHLYFGLFISPIVVVFSLSVISLNHAWLPWGGRVEGGETISTAEISLDLSQENLELAKDVQRQINIPGEIDFIHRNDDRGRLAFPITAPGYRAEIEVDTQSGAVVVEEFRTGVWDAMNYLHKMPGPHNVSVRGNWIFTNVWAWLADWTVYLVLFVSASGVFLWTALKAERRAGIVFLGTGVMSFLVLVLTLVG